MPQAASYRDLLIWQKSHRFVVDVYAFTTSLPKHELYGLGSQIRRAAVSLPANIAESFRRTASPDKLRFLNIAQTSADEVSYYLLLARDVGYGDTATLELALDEITRMLHSYVAKVRSTPTTPRTRRF